MNGAMMAKIKRMQKEIQEIQTRIANTVFVGTSAGICEVQVKGTHEVVKVTINKEAFESQDDIEMIEDAIVSAYNDAYKQIDKETEKALGPYAGMLGGVL